MTIENILLLVIGDVWITTLFRLLKDLWEAVLIDTFMSFMLTLGGGEMICSTYMAKDPGAVEHVPPVSWIIPADGYKFVLKPGKLRSMIQYVFPGLINDSRNLQHNQELEVNISRVIACNPQFIR